jgi:hypothetical protein
MGPVCLFAKLVPSREGRSRREDPRALPLNFEEHVRRRITKETMVSLVSHFPKKGLLQKRTAPTDVRRIS